MRKKELDNFLLKGNLNLLPATFLDAKESQVLTRVSSLMRYWSDEELYPSLLLSLLSFPKQFKKIRSVAHLGRVICAEFFYKKKVIQAIDRSPQKRHLYLKLLKTYLQFPFGSKGVMGMVVTFNLMKHREAFEEQHILEAVRRVVPGVNVVKGSLVDDQDKHNQVHTVYFEIEREDHPEFSLDEVKRLQNLLTDELKGCIEQLVPMTFMRRNEEEVYRNVLTLRDQLKSVRDLPQATISFDEQTQFDLYFTVVLLRLVKGDEPTIQDLLERHCSDFLFIPDRVDYVGSLRRVYQKEATVFRVQISKCPFYRKDRSVNLYKARRHVVSMLMKALGPFRDYNGGLILKQNERLEDFLALMPKAYDEFFLENFFYSITPIAMQSILPAVVVKEWFEAFSELLNKEAPVKSPYLILCRQFEESSAVVIRTEESSVKEILLKGIKKLSIPSLEFGFTEINQDGTYCFGVLYRPSLINNEIDLCSVIKEIMTKYVACSGEKQSLRLAIHGNEPSLDPRINKGDQSHIIIKMLFEGLTRIGLEGKPELAIAESYEVTADYKTYTFVLRDSKWSNGAPITAYDFEYSWKNALRPQAHSVSSNAFYLIKNARRAQEGDISLDEVGIKAIDKKTLVVELESPAPYFLEVVAHWTYSLINSSIDQKYPGWAYQAGEKYVSNGPFKLTEWRHNRAITVEKNPYYWDGESVQLNRISIHMMEKEVMDAGLLTKHEVDILGRPMTTFPSGGLEVTAKDIKSVAYDLNGVYALCFNTKIFPFNHKKIRQAFSYAIDRTHFHTLIPHEFGKASYSILPGELSLNNKEELFPRQNLEKARALFREGLGEIGFVKSDFPKLMLTHFSGSRRGNLLEELCRQWEEAFDIPIYLESYDRKTHFDNLLTGNYQMGGVELDAHWNDPLHILESFEESTDSLNIPFWENECYKQLLKEARLAESIEKRDLYLKKAEMILANEMPAIPLYQLKGRYLKSQRLKGELPSNCFQMDFKWAYRED